MPPARRSALVVAVALAALPAAGCGGAPAEDEVRSAWKGAASAAAAGDATEFCERVSAEGRDTLAERLGVSCEDAIRLLAPRLDARDRRAIEDAEITSVEVSGDEATVRYESTAALAKLGFTGRTTMIRVDDRWLLEGV
jgi:hypothetical protein